MLDDSQKSGFCSSMGLNIFLNIKIFHYYLNSESSKGLFLKRLVHYMFHARCHSKLVATLLYFGFTRDQFGSVFNSMKIIVAFRRNNFSTGLTNASLTAFMFIVLVCVIAVP